MKNMREEVNLLKESIADIEDNNYKNCFLKMTNIIESLNEKLQELSTNMEAIDENMGFIDSDLSDIQDELFEEVSLEDLNDIEEQFVETNCIHCNKSIFIEKSALDDNKEIPCPYCGKSVK